MVLLSGCSSGLLADQGAQSSGSSNEAAQEGTAAGPFDWFLIENTRNRIKDNQPGYSGDIDPDHVRVFIDLEVTNNCDQAIDGIKGSIDFQNVVGDTIFRANLVIDETIEPGATVETPRDEFYEFNMFQDEHGILLTVSADKARAVTEIERVVFSDGTIVEE